MTDKIKTSRSAAQIKGALLLTLTSLIWGSAFVAQRAGMDHIEPFTFLCIRSFMAGLALFLYIALTARLSRVSLKEIFTRNTLIGGLFCGLALLFGMAFQQFGLVTTTAGKAGFLTATYIIIVPALGALFGKRPPKIIWLSVAVALAGLYLLTVKEGLDINSGDIMIILCAFCFSVHILIVDNFTPKASPIAMSCLQFWVVALFSLPFMLLSETPDMAQIFNARLPLVYTGIISGGLAFTFQILAQKELSPPVASIIMSLESVFAVLSGWLILGEKLLAREAIGCLLMLAAVLLAQSPAFSAKMQSKAQEETITAG